MTQKKTGVLGRGVTVRVPVAFRNKCERVTSPQPERVRSIFAGVNATRTQYPVSSKQLFVLCRYIIYVMSRVDTLFASRINFYCFSRGRHDVGLHDVDLHDVGLHDVAMF